MSEDLSKKIKQITDILGQENMPDNIKGLLSLLTSTGNKEESSPKASELQTAKEEKPVRSELEESMEMISKVKKVMDRLNTNTDPRVNLLLAIKPFLNSKRQKKLSSCVNILRMSSLTKFVDENGKGIF